MKTQRYALSIILLAAAFSTSTVHAAALDKTGTLWSPYLEWSFSNPTYSGNAFDLIASATFTHSATGSSHTTDMFYAGSDTWKLRFTGTKTGTWTVTTASADPDLDNMTGTITINPNTDPAIKGFLTASGHRFARQSGEADAPDPFIFNVYQSDGLNISVDSLYGNPDADLEITKAINEASDHGFRVLYSGVIANRWFNLETQSWDGHSSTDPDLRTFKALEYLIRSLHAKGYHLHIWAWGDESRKQTPIGAGGINGTPDKRIQRYIAARLGPLPGWTMGYGFDLQEWVSEAQVGEWADYMHSHLGWPHMLWARGRSHSSLDALAYSGFDDYGYSEANSRIAADLSRPHIYSERFIYLRRSYWDMDGTRRKLWQYLFAGGMGSWWGWWSGVPSTTYPNPEQLVTFQEFWDKRDSLDLQSANGLTDGVALKSADNRRLVFYREDTDTIRIDLSGLSTSLPAIAVDTKSAYAEIDIGSLNPADQTWTAPYSSDWAIAVGAFSGSTSTQPPQQKPTGLSIQKFSTP